MRKKPAEQVRTGKERARKRAPASGDAFAPPSRTRGDIIGEERANELRALHQHIQRWLDHIVPWLAWDTTYEEPARVKRYGETLVLVLRDMAWAARGLKSRRPQEDLRNELLAGVDFYGQVIANARGREDRPTSNADDEKRAEHGAEMLLGAVLQWLAPAVAERLRPEKIAEVILAKAASLTSTKGKRAPRPRGSGYLPAFAALWEEATRERVDATAIRTSHARWRRHRSAKNSVSDGRSERTFEGPRKEAKAKGIKP